eukprot:UC1_evm1s1611
MPTRAATRLRTRGAKSSLLKVAGVKQETTATTAIKNEDVKPVIKADGSGVYIKREPGVESTPPAKRARRRAGAGGLVKPDPGFIKMETVKAEEEEEDMKHHHFAATVTKEDFKNLLGPYPEFMRPNPAELQLAYDGLAALHGDPMAEDEGCHGQESVLDSLVRTMLSQNTTDITSARAFRQLKSDFPTWERALAASQDRVAASIRCCGLADIRAERIQGILSHLSRTPQGLSLEHLRALDDAAAKKALTSFKGVGPKTASCVLMFCMGRADFPVDTHVWRISRVMGWCPGKAGREQCYDHMNARVPPHLRHGLHVLLVRHGKACPDCAKNGKNRHPAVGPCPLVPLRRSSSSKKVS